MCVFGMESFPEIGLRKTEINTAMLHYIGVSNWEAEYLLQAFPLVRNLGGTSKYQILSVSKATLLMNSRKANKTPFPLCNKSLFFFL